jgi:chemotaxis protein CheC
MELTEDQKDLLLEVFNMGMGQSLNALSQLAGKEFEITFKQPSLSIKTKREILDYIISQKTSVIINQNYQGKINGSAVIIFPENSGMELVKLILGTDLPADEMVKLEHDAILEIANIFINTALSSLANFVGDLIRTQLPKLSFLGTKSLLEQNPESLVIFIDTIFEIKQNNLNAKIVLILDSESMETLVKLLDQFNVQLG